MSVQYQVGDPVIYTKQKASTSPGRRADQVSPAQNGELYTYVVDKFWTVSELLEDGSLRLRTRRGKEHIIPVDDPMLRKAKWWERILYSGRFRPQP